MYRPAVLGCFTFSLLYRALILQVGSNMIGFLIIARMLVSNASHGIYTSYFDSVFAFSVN